MCGRVCEWFCHVHRLQHIHCVVHIKVLDDFSQLIVRNTVDNMLLVLNLQEGKHIRRQLFRQYIGLKRNMTVEQAFAYIRENGVDKETIYTCFVTDSKRQLQGVVTVKDLLMNPYHTIIKDIMDENIIYAVTTEDQEEVVETFNKYDLLCLPVVDHEDRLVGIVTVDDVVEVMEQEATEDFEKMAAMLPSLTRHMPAENKSSDCTHPQWS